jgi:hypothetical protein
MLKNFATFTFVKPFILAAEVTWDLSSFGGLQDVYWPLVLLLGSLVSRRTWRHLAATVGTSRKQGVQ